LYRRHHLAAAFFIALQQRVQPWDLLLFGRRHALPAHLVGDRMLLAELDHLANPAHGQPRL